jgi:hypothetical protein
MKTIILALALTLATSTSALAQVPPLPGTPLNMAPQPGSSQTANLLFEAMMAVAHSAATNPAASQAANMAYQHALQSYNTGDVTGANSQAISALIQANAAQPTQIPVLKSTIPQTSAVQTAPFPIAGGSVAQVDADAFVAQARGAVAACTAAKSPNTAAAATNLAAAQNDAAAGRYMNVRVEARAAVNLCAQAQASR